MQETRVKISEVIQNQLPQYIRNDSPLLVDFLRQYYISIESKGQVLDILENIDEYVKVDNLTKIKDNTKLIESISFFDDIISVESTLGFPDSYGLIKINDEIISYETKTETQFLNCHRGFSGIESYGDSSFERDLIFKKTEVLEHSSGSIVENISLLFLKIFLEKIKKQFTPGFENRSLVDDLNQSTFIKHSKDFYSSKGTISSFEILFNALYGEKVKIINPSDFLFSPSNNNFLVTKDIVVEPIQGNPEELVNQTLYQDNDGYFPKSSATISKVEKFVRNNKEYYTLSLDFGYNRDNETEGTFIGDFSIHPKTRIIGDVKINQTYIDVDSTVGFPNFGDLVLNVNGINFFIKYKSKTLNQFLECENISVEIKDNSEIRLNSYAYGFSYISGNEVRVRIGGVLSDLEIKSDTFLCGEGDSVEIISPGIQLDSVKSEKWLYNIPLTYDAIPSFSFNAQTNLGVHNGEIVTLDEHNFFDNDELTIIVSNGFVFNTKVSSVRDKNKIIVNPPLPTGNSNYINRSFTYKVKRNLLKAKFTNYPEVGNVNSNVQNVYYDLNDESIYVASSSLPNYFNRNLNITDGSITFSGIQNNNLIRLDNHPFLSGDVVYYSYGNSNKNLPIEENSYFVERVDGNFIKLYKSKEDLYLKKNIEFDSTEVSNNKISFFEKFGKKIESQRLLRKFSHPVNDEEENNTPPGLYTGMLLNGVEILNYKSRDYVYYGGIESVDAISTLENYDVINPPKVLIKDPNGVGIGASIILHIEGNLKKINIEDQGFDYLNTPKVEIVGGNGIDAKAEVKLVSFKHISNFNSENSSVVNLDDYTITFADDHKFRDIEEVIYRSNNQTEIAGLVNDTIYYLKSIDAKKIKLYNNIDDAILGINTVGFTSTGLGVHSLISTQSKKKIGSVNVLNSGKNYKNKQVIVESTNINFRKNVVIAKNHGYKDGDVIEYFSTGNQIENVPFGKYFVKVINKNEFSLVQILENSNLQSDFNLNTNNVIDFRSSGTGVHYFNTPKIIVSVEGIVGVNTFSSEISKAKLQPIFRGSIENIFIFSSGEKYGVNNIINYERQPVFELLTGTGALLRPVILNGKIESVSVLNSGNNYESSPDLEIIGDGFGAILTPIVNNGKIIEVKVISKGFGYTSGKTEIIVSTEKGRTILKSKIKSWNINNYYRFLNTNVILDQSSILSNPLNQEFGLQYSHLTLPQSIRKILKTSKQFEDTLVTISDFQNDSLSEQERIHSPIIGWAYDGNPIYGPYGFNTPNGGNVRRMISGYELRQSVDRPSYPNEFFVEDYIFTGKGDLDESNGRYCITPEFPEGTYAYFCTINENFNPVFPFIIGNRYKSSPIEFNFNPNSNQNDIDINEQQFIRNTKPFKILSKNSDYPYINDPNSIKQQNSVITSVKSGTLDHISVQLPGENYKVGDKIILESVEDDLGVGASAEVSEIIGKEILNIETNINSIDNVLFSKSTIFDNFIGISTQPHGLTSGNFISICDCKDTDIIIDNKFYEIKVEPTILTLAKDVGDFNVTGSITYFEIYGNIKYPYIMVDDIFIINDEKVKILSIDLNSKKIKVLRGIDSTSITAHSAGDILTELPRKFYLNLEIDKNYNINKRYYFNPSEALGIGTIIGIGTTVSLDGSDIFIPSRTIYLPDHGLSTGDKLIYNTNFGVGIDVSKNGISNFTLDDGSNLFVSKISNDFIGISTDNIGLWENGTYNTLENSQSILYFNSVGQGVNHSFITNYDNIFSGKINNIVTKLSTREDHLLKIGDSIDLELISNKTIIYNLSYDLNSRNLLFNKREVISVDLDNITLTIPNHGFLRGQKVVFNSFNPPLNVYNSEKFYVIIVDQNRVKLSRTYFGSLNNKDIVILDIDGVYTPNGGSYFLSLVNPQISVYKNQTIIFNLEDENLLGFDFNLYEDSKYRNIFYGIRGFNVIKNGLPGNPNSSLTLKVYDEIPTQIYYNLSIPNKNISQDKLEYYIDNINIPNNNSILITNSRYTSKHTIVGLGTTYFEFNLKTNPEDIIYNNNINSTIKYKTNSKNSKGSISKVKVTSGGRNFKKLPIVKKIISKEGFGAILDPRTSTIGKINNIQIIDIGFDYFSDRTLRPQSKIPEILKINPLTSLDFIQVIDFGERYNTAPNLVLIDGFTKKPVNDVLIDFNLNQRFVNIIKNTSGIYNVPPRIVPINNSNGIGIESIEYLSQSKEIRVVLSETYSEIFQFPFAKSVAKTLNDVEIFTDKIIVDDASQIPEFSLIKIFNEEGQIITNEVIFVKEKTGNVLSVERGYFETEIPNTPFKYNSKSNILLLEKNVLIENINIFNGTGKEYNSKFYDFKLYPLKQIIPQLGGESPQIILDASDFIEGNQKFGDFDSENSLGIVVPESYFPKFNIALKKNIFYKGEKVSTENSIGVVEYWDKENELLRVRTSQNFDLNSVVIGESSLSKATIVEKIDFKSYYNINSSSIVIKSWDDNYGFLNSDLQKVHDNFYYQYFSYSVKSRVQLKEWDNSVKLLNHTSGFKKFSELQIETQDKGYSGIQTSQNNSKFISSVDLTRTIDVNCKSDYDLVKENSILFDNSIVSDQIIFESRELVDYFNCIGNRVLRIDDISTQFRSTERLNIVNRFTL